MEFNIPGNEAKYAQVAMALGCEKASSDAQTAQNGVLKIKELIKACGIPARLSEVGVPQNAIEQMAKDAMKIQRLLKNNPREITEQDAVQIFQSAY